MTRWRAVAAGLAAAVAVLVLGTAVGAVLMLRTAYHAYTIPSGAMQPTLLVGSRVLVQKGASVSDGDIVVFTDREFGGSTYVKRVIAKGGETVACCTGGLVTRDGTALDEPYLLNDGPDRGNTSFAATTVPRDRLWVLGDHRANSSDSRFHINDGHQGTVAESDVVGVVVAKGSAGAVYGYVLDRAAALAAVLALLVGVGVVLVLRRRRPPAVPVWAPGGEGAPTLEGP